VTLILLLSPPILFALANLLDYFLVRGGGREESNPMALMVIGGIFNLGAAIFLSSGQGMTPLSFESFIALAVVNGALFTLAMWFYLIALKERGAPQVVPWFQVIPVFGIVFAFVVLGELPRWFEILAIVGIIVGGLMLTGIGNALVLRVIVLMLLSSGLLAANDVIFAHYGRGLDWVSVLYADMLGKAIWAPVFLLSRDARRGVSRGLLNKLGLCSLAEIACILADALFDIGKLRMPVALMEGSCCLQPFFVVGGAYLCSFLFPELFDRERGGMFRKLVAIAAMVICGIIITVSRA